MSCRTTQHYLPKVQGTPHLLPGRTEAVSGLYLLTPDQPKNNHLPKSVAAVELRLDIDYWFPQNMCSVTVLKKRGKSSHAVANKIYRRNGRYTFKTKKKWGGIFPFEKRFSIQLSAGQMPSAPEILLSVKLRKGAWKAEFRLRRKSPSFRAVNLEYDRVAGVQSVVTMPVAVSHVGTDAPTVERMSVDEVITRCGVRLDVLEEHTAIPSSFAGSDMVWSKRELHDAMQSYWSCYSNKPQWSMWVLFANLFSESSAVAGMMFDTSGKAQRRGLALFNRSIMFDPPSGVPSPGAWRKRMLFFTLCHEMGHLFNLAHTWEKSEGKSWMGIENDDDSLSFMNNPHFYSDGYTAFFERFGFRFDDGELQFLRHAPAEFVEMGNEAWFDNHALSLSQGKNSSVLSLELRTGRKGNRYTFMEPVVIECKLKNISAENQTIDCTEEQIADICQLSIFNASWKVPKKLQWHVRSDYMRTVHVLEPGASLFASLFISADARDWIIDTPGSYSVQALLHVNNQPLVSNQCRLTVVKPRSRHIETVAADYFNTDVGRVLAFDGSSVLDKANSVLRRCIEPGMPEEVAQHARVALALPLVASEKRLNFNQSRRRGALQPNIELTSTDTEFAARELNHLFNAPRSVVTKTAEALGNIDFKKYADVYTTWLESEGRSADAAKIQRILFDVLVGRGVKKADILKRVKKRAAELKR